MVVQAVQIRCSIMAPPRRLEVGFVLHTPRDDMGPGAITVEQGLRSAGTLPWAATGHKSTTRNELRIFPLSRLLT
jgi:hypothetical protein